MEQEKALPQEDTSAPTMEVVVDDEQSEQADVQKEEATPMEDVEVEAPAAAAAEPLRQKRAEFLDRMEGRHSNPKDLAVRLTHEDRRHRCLRIINVCAAGQFAHACIDEYITPTCNFVKNGIYFRGNSSAKDKWKPLSPVLDGTVVSSVSAERVIVIIDDQKRIHRYNIFDKTKYVCAVFVHPGEEEQQDAPLLAPAAPAAPPPQSDDAIMCEIPEVADEDADAPAAAAVTPAPAAPPPTSTELQMPQLYLHLIDEDTCLVTTGWSHIIYNFATKGITRGNRLGFPTDKPCVFIMYPNKVIGVVTQALDWSKDTGTLAAHELFLFSPPLYMTCMKDPENRVMWIPNRNPSDPEDDSFAFMFTQGIYFKSPAAGECIALWDARKGLVVHRAYFPWREDITKGDNLAMLKTYGIQDACFNAKYDRLMVVDIAASFYPVDLGKIMADRARGLEASKRGAGAHQAAKKHEKQAVLMYNRPIPAVALGYTFNLAGGNILTQWCDKQWVMLPANTRTVTTLPMDDVTKLLTRMKSVSLESLLNHTITLPFVRPTGERCAALEKEIKRKVREYPKATLTWEFANSMGRGQINVLIKHPQEKAFNAERDFIVIAAIIRKRIDRLPKAKNWRDIAESDFPFSVVEMDAETACNLVRRHYTLTVAPQAAAAAAAAIDAGASAERPPTAHLEEEGRALYAQICISDVALNAARKAVAAATKVDPLIVGLYNAEQLVQAVGGLITDSPETWIGSETAKICETYHAAHVVTTKMCEAFILQATERKMILDRINSVVQSYMQRAADFKVDKKDPKPFKIDEKDPVDVAGFKLFSAWQQEADFEKVTLPAYQDVVRLVS